MSDYTPTTDDVRGWYAGARYVFGDPDRQHPDMEAEFDRWLAAHDAEVRAAALAEQDTEEAEWEYGTRYYEPITGGYPVMRDGHEFPWDGPKHDVTRVRRTKAIPAGPWMPVEQEGESNA